MADSEQARTLTLYLALAAIPALAVTAISFYGELVDGSADDEAGAVYVGLTSLALLLLLIGASVRAHTLENAAVPALGISTLVGALALLGLQLGVWTSLRLSRERLVNQRSPASDV